MKGHWKTPLPRAVRRQADAANQVINDIWSYRELHPRRGAPRTAWNYKKPAIVTGSTVDEVDRRLKTLEAILGTRTRGNVRWGRIAQYAELMEEFERLQTTGVKLPSDNSLSANACRHGLGDWLRRYGYTSFSDNGLIRSRDERKRVYKKCGSAFSQARRVLETYPPKIT